MKETFNIGHVQGGTNAGWRRTSAASTREWTCACPHPSDEARCHKVNPAYQVNCPGCGETRPEDAA